MWRLSNPLDDPLSEIPLRPTSYKKVTGQRGTQNDLQGGGVVQHHWTTTANTAVSDFLLILMLRRKLICHGCASESQIHVSSNVKNINLLKNTSDVVLL